MSTVGQAAGYVIGGVVGAAFPAVGWVIGAQIGGMIGGYIDPPKGKNTVGPRLEDLTVQTSTYGAVLPRIKGTIAVTGNVFWLEGDKLREHTSTKKSGGKGGPTSKQTTFSYSATFAVGLSHQISEPVAGIRRLWLANTLVYDAGSGDLASIIASNQMAGVMFKFYDGNDDQLPDPRMQADKGAANVSGYPGRAYIVFYDLDLTEHYNNSLMMVQAKVELVSGNTGSPAHTAIFTTPDVDGERKIVSAVVVQGGVKYAVARVRSLDGQFYGVDYYESRFGEYLKKTASVDHLISVTYYRTGVGTLFVSHNRDGGINVITQQGDWLSLKTQLTFISGGTIVESEWLTSAQFTYGYYNIAACDEGSSFLADSGAALPILRFDGAVRGSKSSVSVQANCIALSENRVFVLNYTGSTSSTTVTVLNRTDLSLVSNYTQAVNGYRGVLHVVSDTEFYVAAGSALSHWVDGVAENLGAVCHSPTGSYTYRWAAIYNDPDYFVQFDPSSGSIYELSGFITNFPISAQVAKLRDVVTEECALAGVSSADIDLTELIDSDVRGYRVSQAGSVRSVLEQLQAAFPFDVIQSGYKLKFKSRGGSSVLTVPESDLGAHSSGDVPTRFMLTTEMPSQIPAKVTFNFLNSDREYDPDEQSATFTAQDVKNSYTVSLPLVMTPTEALQAADVLLKKEWHERSTAGTFLLPPTDDYRKLEAADVIDVIAQGRTHTLRLIKVTQLPDGRIECDGKLTASAAYTSTAQAQDSLVLGQTLVPLAGSSELLLLDIPRIVSEQDVPGISLGMYGYTSGWNGGVAFRSDDFGESYNAILALPEKTEVFRVLVTPALVPHYGIDHVTALIVSPEWVGADLFSITKIQLYALGNLAAYGAPGRWEIVCFKTVVDNGDGTYTLRDFLRGRFGSDWAMTLHGIEDRLVMLDPDRVDFAGMPLTNLGAERLWRGVTSGASIDSTQDKVNTYSGNNLMPISPVCLRGWRNPTTFDYYIQATRRSRWPTELFSGLETPLGESSEQYEAEIWDVDFTSRKRVFSGLSSPSITWTQAQQLADFGYEASNVGVKLRQVSSVIGGGRWLKKSISRVLLDDPYIGSVVLLLHMDDVALSDVKGHTVSIDGSVSRSSVQSKFGGYSALFAAGGRLRIPYTTDLAFGAGDFTIEMFVYVSSYNASLSRFWSPNGPLYDGISFSIDTSGHLNCYCSSNNLSWDLVAATNIVTVTTGAFKWIVFQRRGPNLDCYYEGTRYAVSTSLGTTALMTQSTVDHVIGGFVTSDNSLYGHIDEIRVTRAARYTGDTIPVPTQPFNNP